MNTLKSHLLSLISSSYDLLNGALHVAILVVEAVDLDKRTALCHNFEGVPFPDVSLQVPGSSVFLFPRPGSVLLCVLSDLSASVYPLMYSALESAEIVIGDASAVIDADGLRINTKNMSAHINNDDIVFNGGNLNGLVLAQELTDRLNIIEKDINNLKTLFSSWIPIPQDGGAALHSAAAAWASSQLTPTKISDYENTKIKQ